MPSLKSLVPPSFLSCFYQTHTSMLPSWFMKACESATSLFCFFGPKSLPPLSHPQLLHSIPFATQVIPLPLTGILRSIHTHSRILSISLWYLPWASPVELEIYCISRLVPWSFLWGLPSPKACSVIFRAQTPALT